MGRTHQHLSCRDRDGAKFDDGLAEEEALLHQQDGELEEAEVEDDKEPSRKDKSQSSLWRPERLEVSFSWEVLGLLSARVYGAGAHKHTAHLPRSHHSRLGA